MTTMKKFLLLWLPKVATHQGMELGEDLISHHRMTMRKRTIQPRPALRLHHTDEVPVEVSDVEGLSVDIQHIAGLRRSFLRKTASIIVCHVVLLAAARVRVGNAPPHTRANTHLYFRSAWRVGCVLC